VFAMSVRALLLLAILAQAAPLGSAQDDEAAKLAAVATADPSSEVLFFEPFRSGWIERWKNSSDSKYDGVWQHAEEYSVIPEDHGLKMGSAGKLHAIAAPIEGGLTVKDSTLVVQYEVRATNGVSCDGSYLKLLQADAGRDLAKFDNDARYTIMFGPDKCGATDKVHFILQHQNPVSKEWEEKHALSTPGNVLNDRLPHLYTLVIRPDNSFEILVDLESRKSGSLLKDMDPPVNPDKEIDDPDDKKPSDWVDEAEIDDPDASKPDDWDEDAAEFIEDPDAVKPSGWLDDEPMMVNDPSATAPSDWDEEEDGEWEAPLIANPKCKSAPGCGEWKRPTIRNPEYKGKWFPPKIPNPKYKGEWKPRRIPNKNWFEDLHPHNVFPMSAIGFELLSISGGIVYDNVLITSSEETAKSFARETWKIRYEAEAAKQRGGSGGIVDTISSTLAGLQEGILDLYDEQPLVVISLAVVFAVVLVTMIVVCCGGESKKEPAPSSAAKKTDEPQPDDDEDGAAAEDEAGAAGVDDDDDVDGEITTAGAAQ